jgi:elongation factor 3
MVSANAGVLDKCCTRILQIEDIKLKCVKGNLTHFVSLNPKTASYFELKSTSGLAFKFPQPGFFLDGVKSRGAPLMKMDAVSFTYPGNPAPTVVDIKTTCSPLC